MKHISIQASLLPASNSSHVALYPATACHCLCKNCGWRCRPEDRGAIKNLSVCRQRPAGKEMCQKKSSWQREGDAFAGLNLSLNQEIPFRFGSQSSATYTAINCHVALRAACLHLCCFSTARPSLCSSTLFTHTHTF